MVGMNKWTIAEWTIDVEEAGDGWMGVGNWTTEDAEGAELG